MAQPFYAIEFNSFMRIFQKLHDGEPWVKSYIGMCPHPIDRETEKCDCPYYKNILNKNGFVVREVDGELKPVFAVRDDGTFHVVVKGKNRIICNEVRFQ
jgi:hypothetical protein